MILRKYPWLKYASVIGLLITLVGLSAANLQFVDRTPAGSDFLPFWTATRAWLKDGLSPYAPEVQQDAEDLVYGRLAKPSLGEAEYSFLYPFPALLLTLFYGLLDYPVARALWMTVLELAMPITVLLAFGIRRWKTSPLLIAVSMLLVFIWFPGFSGVINGQISILITFFLAGVLLAIQRDSLLTAGVLLGAASLKPQLSGILIFFLLVWGIRREKWNLILSFVGTALILWAGSFVLEPQWLIQWARRLVTALGQGLSVAPALTLFSALSPVFEEPLGWLFIALAVLSLIWEWGRLLLENDRAFTWVAAYTLLITVFLIPSLNIADQVILILPLIVILDYADSRWKDRSIRINLSFLVILVGTSWLGLLNSGGNVSLSFFSYVMPMLVFIGLRWSRWWALHAADWWDGSMLG